MKSNEQKLWTQIAQALYPQCPDISAKIVEFKNSELCKGFTLRSKGSILKLSANGMNKKNRPAGGTHVILQEEIRHEKDEVFTGYACSDGSCNSVCNPLSSSKD